MKGVAALQIVGTHGSWRPMPAPDNQNIGGRTARASANMDFYNTFTLSRLPGRLFCHQHAVDFGCGVAA